MIAKKSDGIKESTDSNATVEEDDQRGYGLFTLVSYCKH